VLHYTGTINNVAELKTTLTHIPRLILRPVDEIKLDNNLKKIIRTQAFRV